MSAIMDKSQCERVLSMIEKGFPGLTSKAYREFDEYCTGLFGVTPPVAVMETAIYYNDAGIYAKFLQDIEGGRLYPSLVFGDVVKDSAGKVIVHQVNTRGVTGGLAGYIARLFPEWNKAYKNLCASGGWFYGYAWLFGEKGRLIASLFSQNGISKARVTTDYKAMRDALMMLSSMYRQQKRFLAFPYKIGCGMAGGDWDYVYGLIANGFGNTATIYYKEM